MRGPIPQVLAESYRDAADLVMFESYVHSQKSYWWIATQVWSARRYGILPKTIMILGVGKGGNPGENWAETKEELEQQIRFVRLIAPESPGIGIFRRHSGTAHRAPTLCAPISSIFPPTAGDCPPRSANLRETFSRRYEKPTLVASPSLGRARITRRMEMDWASP